MLALLFEDPKLEDMELGRDPRESTVWQIPWGVTDNRVYLAPVEFEGSSISTVHSDEAIDAPVAPAEMAPAALQGPWRIQANRRRDLP